MSLIGKKIEEFKVPAFHNGALIDVTEKDSLPISRNSLRI